MFLLLLSGGILLAWLLGGKEAIKLLRYSETAKASNIIILTILSGVLAIIGTVWYGNNTADTIAKLGQTPSISAALIIALATIASTISLYKLNIKHSIIQCVVGAMIGWAFFSGYTDSLNTAYSIIAIWIISPMLSGIISMILYLCVKWMLKKLKIHLIILDSYVRIGAIISISIAAVFFGANNVGAIIGIYSKSIPNIQLNFDIIQISGIQLTFVICSIALFAGMLTKQIFNTKKRWKPDKSVMPETAVIVIISQAIVFYLFTSKGLSNILYNIGLFSIPAVPLSIYHISEGAMLGLGIIKDTKDPKYHPVLKSFGNIIITLVFSAITSFAVLSATKNSLGISYVENTVSSLKNEFGNNNIFIHDINGINIIWLLAFVLTIAIIAIVYIYYNKQRKQWLITKTRLNFERKEHDTAIQALTEANLKAITIENSYLNNKLESKHQELISYALNIVEQQEFLAKIHDKLRDILSIKELNELHKKTSELLLSIKQKMNTTEQVESFYTQIEQINISFTKRLKNKYPELSEKEQRLIKLLKLGFSSKEIAPLLGISPKSVEIARYRLRKKFNLLERENLIDFVNSI